MPRKEILCAEGEVERVEEVEQTFKQWQLFAKMEELNYIHHREVYPLLHQFLSRFSRPFTLLDLGCGDAGFMAQALQGTAIAYYVGVELSPVALALARQNLTSLQCQQQWLEKDYYEVVQAAEIRAEVIWLGLTFHHLPLPQKASFLHLARRILADDGYLLMYEPTLLEEEDREQFLARSWQISCSWTGLTETEVEKLRQHIAACDFPEKISTLEQLGRQQGFSGLSVLYQAPEKIWTMVCLAA